jgi:hypothetical protein
MELKDKRCLECLFYSGHSPFCSLQSIDDLRANVKTYYEAWLKQENKQREWRERMLQQTNMWRGKFLEVKNENNKLRKKLFQQAKKLNQP